MFIDPKLSIGRRLRILPVAKGLRQKDVADASGLTDSLISQIETDDREPRDSELRAILKALGARPVDLGLPKGAP